MMYILFLWVLLNAGLAQAISYQSSDQIIIDEIIELSNKFENQELVDNELVLELLEMIKELEELKIQGVDITQSLDKRCMAKLWFLFGLRSALCPYIPDQDQPDFEGFSGGVGSDGVDAGGGVGDGGGGGGVNTGGGLGEELAQSWKEAT